MRKPAKPATHFGRLEFGEELSSGDGNLREQPFRWIPNRRVLKTMPKGFTLDFQLLTCEGYRHIRPAARLLDFVRQASFSGFALLRLASQLSAEQRQTYRLMSLLFEWTCSTRRLHARSIDRLQDLIPTRKERSLLNGLTLLPEELTTSASGAQRAITAEELIASGKNFADDEGLGAQPFDRTLDLALLSLALRSPQAAQVKTGDISRYLSFALFGFDGGSKVAAPELLELIEGNFIDLLGQHLDDNEQQFHEWMGDVSGICRAIARRKDLGAVTSDQVRYVLFRLLMNSHQYISQCVELQMRHVCQLVNPQLNATEWVDAKLWYQRQKWLGSCCSVVLHTRLLSLVPVLTLLHENPDRQNLWPAWLQSTLWKAQIILARRELEKQKKTGASKDCQLQDEGWENLEIDADDPRRGKWRRPGGQ